jgi:two-component system response regulator FlrC
MSADTAVLVIEDDAGLRDALATILGDAGYTVLAAPDVDAALRHMAEETVGLAFCDVRLPGRSGLQFLAEARRQRPDVPVVMMTAYGTVSDAVAALHAGAVDYLVKPFVADVVLARARQHVGAERRTPDDEPVAVDERMRIAVALAAQVAASDVTVMISGESGTGKEVLARFIHRRSPRRTGPFVAINCAAIPENMLEAMLFGFEKGAFTGAIQSAPGKFELAQDGTLLLDEISEMALGLQAKLLRVLQEREVERIGGRRSIALNVRVIATTNRRLREEVAAGRFREDLYFRLNVFPLHVPPLRERPADIVPLARTMLARHARASGRVPPRLAADAIPVLQGHAWPGNVRELENLLVRAMVLQPGPELTGGDLTPEAPVTAPAPRTAADVASLDNHLRNHEHALIIEALRAESGNRKNASERLGISPRTLRYKLAQMRAAGVPIAS